MPKKRIVFREMPECLLCGKQSMMLKIRKFCPCITTEEDYESVTRLVNGHSVTDFQIRKERDVKLKEKYLAETRLALPAPSIPVVKNGIKKKKKQKKPETKTRKEKNEFYNSWEWKEKRYKVLTMFGAKCMLCGATSKDSKICVDHIIPLSRDWSKRLDINNLQVLCEDCNMGKSNKDTSDFR